jgi:hypothetical protein
MAAEELLSAGRVYEPTALIFEIFLFVCENLIVLAQT